MGALAKLFDHLGWVASLVVLSLLGPGQDWGPVSLGLTSFSLP